MNKTKQTDAIDRCGAARAAMHATWLRLAAGAVPPCLVAGSCRADWGQSGGQTYGISREGRAGLAWLVKPRRWLAAAQARGGAARGWRGCEGVSDHVRSLAPPSITATLRAACRALYLCG